MTGGGVSTSDVLDTFEKPSVDSSAGVLDWVILKIAQRCNLDCTYCYVYNRGTPRGSRGLRSYRRK